jgi:membrane-associated phospholipid phosphatase
VWAGVAGALALTAGPRGRRAGLRGITCYGAAALLHLPIKALFGRRHPPRAAWYTLGPFTSSFPSGHAASDLAFNLGAAQEIPLLFLPMSVATTAVHWSLIRKRSHYVSDVVAGGALGIAVALAAWKLWPPGGSGPQTDLGPGQNVDGSRPLSHATNADPEAVTSARGG